MDKRYTAPIVVAVLMILTALAGGVFYFWIFSEAAFPAFVRVLTVAITLGVIGTLAAVLIQRLKEIQGGEEDDISKY